MASNCLRTAYLSVIDRKAIVRQFNPVRNASNLVTPMQVGNGNFAFGTDVTGLQTFIPYAIMSSWGWKNDSLPPGQIPSEYHGVNWTTHGREVAYDMPDPNLPALSQWMIANPNRMNLGAVGLLWKGAGVTEDDLDGKRQEIDLWSGAMKSTMTYHEAEIEVQTSVHPSDDTVGIIITSDLIGQGEHGIFLDFPYHNGLSKFEAPLVGIWNATSNHTTSLSQGKNIATINHTLDGASYFTTLTWPGKTNVSVSRDSPEAHRYSVWPSTKGNKIEFSVTFTPQPVRQALDAKTVMAESSRWWHQFWSMNGFVDVITGSSDPRAWEMQRRIIVSQYNLMVNEAGKNPPQESGLTNNGWYGKFHMEMFFWHMSHWALWGKWDILNRALPTYARHPIFFAELDYRAHLTNETLQKWNANVTSTADFMADYSWWNTSTGVYDLGPPLYPVSENTPLNSTMNTAFELVYWHWGFEAARTWLMRQGQTPPDSWGHVADNLAPLPQYNGTYVIYEGIGDMWSVQEYKMDHPELVVDMTIMQQTTDTVWAEWNITDCWGWDFPMLAMNAARLGNPSKAVDWLLDELLTFDDAGMPTGGVKVPTPYWPGAGGFLYAIAFMAAGWDGAPNVSARGFPQDGSWVVNWEGLSPAI
ncbi:hypothetical protein DACRYDRAFT_91856 [Dacryopinax primogenitus]|uniref:Six-hairpin glycosidase n=1 Tax=Dacryopinax primogenitus (strain DJM 731) TaxID=1858805 RepID=M5FUG0_DACPD|nr:uncharacterized protein DACRYDRAFT_91856 [Dacryopinax primogenitus]EJT96876.1 hypothetical protein DACRYDRAFT_91856 [Dacryopinax primogenitus]